MRALLAPLVLLLSAPAALAADLLVNPGDSIQQAIDSALPGDRILVAPGTYVGQLVLGADPIELIGLGGPLGTVLDGAGSGPVLRIASGTTPATLVQGFTVQNGHTSLGAGGIQTGSGTPRLEDCVVRANSGRFGGGISGDPIMRRCVVRNNTASLTHGGGIYGAPTMTDCVVVANTATSARGGGLYLTGGDAVVSDSLIVDNRIVFGDPARGAGIAVDGSATALVRRCVIANNVGQGNIFGSFGGGLWATSSTRVESCTITGNQLTAGNSQGAGIYGAAEVVNTILGGNQPDEFAGGPSFEWSNVAGGASGIGNFDADPQWVDATLDGDLHLLASSPCIDAGDPATLNPDGSRADVGAYPFRSLYRRSDVALEDWESPGWSELSTSAGGAHRLGMLFDESLAGGLYVVLGTLSGTTPPTALGGLLVPLVPDLYTQLMLVDPEGYGWSGASGTVDGNGRARADFILPAGVAGALAGSQLDHTVIALDPVSLDFAAVTEALGLPLLP